MGRIVTYFLLILALVGVIFFQYQTKVGQLPSEILQLLSHPFNQKVIRQLNLRLAESSSQLTQQLERELETRSRYLLASDDWLEFQKELNQLKEKRLQLKDEVRLLEKWDQKYPNYPALKLLLATLYYRQGNKVAARESLKQVEKLDPNNPLIPKLEFLLK